MQTELTSEIKDLLAEIETLKAKIEKLEGSRQDQLSIALIAGDLDKILAAMIIALAAAAN